MTTTIVRPQAQDDIEEAVLWYRAIDPNLAMRFSNEFESLLGQLDSFPQLFGKVYRDIRLAPLKRFPYNFWYVYHESADIVIVLRVSHKRQDDEQIKWRLPDE